MTERFLRILFGLVFLSSVNVQVGLAQILSETEALRRETQYLGELIKLLRLDIEGVKKGQIKVEKELEEIKNLLKSGQLQAQPQQPQSREAILSVESAPFKGDKNAKLTLIEFSDYQCPFCARHFREALPLIESEYIRTGKLKYVFRDFPVISLHREAFKASEAAKCAEEQGKYWEMHDRIFVTQTVGPKDLMLHAQYLKLELTNFQKCLDSEQQAMRIHKDLADGQKAGVKGTPTFFLGFTEPNDSKIKVLKVIEGAQEFAIFQEAIHSLLSQK